MELHPSETPGSGTWHHGPRPPLRGRRQALLSEFRTNKLPQDRKPPGPFLLNVASAYLSELNSYPAYQLLAHAGQARGAGQRRQGRLESLAVAGPGNKRLLEQLLAQPKS